MTPKCKKCRDTGWIMGDLKSDRLHSMLVGAGIDFEIACDCAAGRAELEKAKRDADDD